MVFGDFSCVCGRTSEPAENRMYVVFLVVGYESIIRTLCLDRTCRIKERARLSQQLLFFYIQFIIICLTKTEDIP